MAEVTEQTSYDRLFLVRMFAFVTVVLMCNLMIVTLAYDFLWERPFHTVLEQERARFDATFNSRIDTLMRYNGDSLYDGLLVKSGIEKRAYAVLQSPDQSDIPGLALSHLDVAWRFLDNFFDYWLLLAYRAGFLMLSLSYLGCLVVAVSIHGMIDRQRKRYAFGDTPVLANLWGRATLSYAIPLCFILWTLPFTVHPFVLVGSLATCVLAYATFAFSLPKIA